MTGATGKVGRAIASALLERGDEVRALVRDPRRAVGVLPDGIEPIQGDATEPATHPPAVEGCELVFNGMGLPEQWVRDEAIFDRVNAQGSGDLARAAREVRRFVHTSTHDVFHAEQGERFDETMLAGYPKGTTCERSKQHAEELVLAEREGMEVVILNPSAVYGPGPAASVLPFEKNMFKPLLKKRLPALPPGGCGLVFSPGVAAGHLLAAEKGADGERYILTDTYADFGELARDSGPRRWPRTRPPLLPVPLARAGAALGGRISRWSAARR